MEQRQDIVQVRNAGMKQVHQIMKDVKSIAEDMNTELQIQDKELGNIHSNMDSGKENVENAQT